MKKDTVTWSDILPYMSIAGAIILFFLHYIFCGNLMIVWACILGLKLHQTRKDFIHFQDNKNLSIKSERTFFEDKRFLIPLYMFNVADTLIWIWQLILFSDKIKPDHFIFNFKPSTWP